MTSFCSKEYPLLEGSYPSIQNDGIKYVDEDEQEIVEIPQIHYTKSYELKLSKSMSIPVAVLNLVKSLVGISIMVCQTVNLYY